MTRRLAIHIDTALATAIGLARLFISSNPRQSGRADFRGRIDSEIDRGIDLGRAKLGLRRHGRRSKSWPLSALSLVVAGYGNCALAQESNSPAYVSEADLLVEIPVFTSASRLTQTLTQVPAAVTIIDREMIDASGITEIPMLLRLVPGFQSYYVRGGQYGVTNHGLGSDFPGDLEVMVDGRSVYQPLFSAVEWTSLGIGVSDIEVIEVVRGPNAPARGSNAFSGAINIITRKPSQSSGAQLNFAGGPENRDFESSYASALGDLSYSFSFGYRQDDGFPSIKNPQQDDIASAMNDGSERAQGRFFGVLAPTLVDTLELQVGGGFSDLGVADGDVSDDRKGYTTREYISHFQSLNWTHISSDRSEWQIALSHNYLRVSERRDIGLLSERLGVPPEFIPLVYPGQQDQAFVVDIKGSSQRFELEFEEIRRVSDQARLVWGAAYRNDRARSRFLFSSEHTFAEESYRLFGNLEHHISAAATLNAGLMLERTGIAGTLFSPRLALNYELTNSDVIRFAVTHGERVPSVLEANQNQGFRFPDGTLLDPDVIPDKDIRESVIDSYEAGYIKEFANGGLLFDLRLYWEQIKDGISTLSIPSQELPGRSVAMNTNVIDADSQGLEVQLDWRPSATTRLRLAYAYADMDGISFRAERLDGSLKFLDLGNMVAAHSASILLDKRFGKGLSLGLIYSYQDEIDWLSSAPIDDYDRLDISLRKSFSLGKYPALVEIVVQNLLDDYAEYSLRNRFETRGYLAFKLSIP